MKLLTGGSGAGEDEINGSTTQYQTFSSGSSAMRML